MLSAPSNAPSPARSSTSSPGVIGRSISPVSPLDKQKAIQGSQYTSIAFGHRCREAGVRPSMGSVGDAYDNAMCESFFATLECELLDRRRFKTQAEARMAAFEFIEGFYIAAAVIPRSVISRPSSTSDATTKAPSIPTHASVPSCLRPSRTSPSGGPKMRPFLTPAAQDGRIVVRVGTEEWRRRGPNKRMDQRRTKCRQIGAEQKNGPKEDQVPSDRIP
jgi:hypothetical protein